MASDSVPISVEDFYSATSPLIGMSLHSLRLGYASTLLGVLGDKSAKLMIEAGWAFKRDNEVLASNQTDPSLLEKAFVELETHEACKVDLVGPALHLYIHFTNGLTLTTAENQGGGDWVIFLRDADLFTKPWETPDCHSHWISCENGMLKHEWSYGRNRFTTSD